jgi:hypothetical protein
MTDIDIKTAKTSALVDFYNAHSGRPAIKKFVDRATAEKRVAALALQLQLAPIVAEVREESEANAATLKVAKAKFKQLLIEGVALSSARTTRHSVFADGIEYDSVKAAFIALGLSLGKHIRFRAALKAEGAKEFEGHSFKLGAVRAAARPPRAE